MTLGRKDETPLGDSNVCDPIGTDLQKNDYTKQPYGFQVKVTSV